MAVRMARGVLSRIREDAEAFALQLRGASDPARAVEVFERAREFFWSGEDGTLPPNLPPDWVAPRWISDVIEIPDGPLILFDATEVPYRHLREIPVILARELEAAGVESGEIVAPVRQGLCDGLRDSQRGLVLCAFPPNPAREPFGEIPSSWYDLAENWLAQADLGVECVVDAGVDFRLDLRALGRIISPIKARLGRIVMVVGAMPTRVAGAHLTGHILTIGLGGSDYSDDELLAAFSHLREFGRAIARDAAYIFLAFPATLEVLLMGTASLGYFHPDADERMAGRDHLQRIPDVMVLDAFPWQVLGADHIARLGGVPEEASPLEGGKYEVQLGDPADWLSGAPARRRKRVQKQGRRLLSRCIMSTDEALDIFYSALDSNEA